jgi:hypothetical protein
MLKKSLLAFALLASANALQAQCLDNSSPMDQSSPAISLSADLNQIISAADNPLPTSKFTSDPTLSPQVAAIIRRTKLKYNDDFIRTIADSSPTMAYYLWSLRNLLQQTHSATDPNMIMYTFEAPLNKVDIELLLQDNKGNTDTFQALVSPRMAEKPAILECYIDVTLDPETNNFLLKFDLKAPANSLTASQKLTFTLANPTIQKSVVKKSSASGQPANRPIIAKNVISWNLE